MNRTQTARIFAAFTLALTLCLALTGCKTKKERSHLKVTATIFPVYDWAQNLCKGTDTQVSMIFTKGADLHNYQPGVQDIARISDSDVFFYIGGESDEWVTDVLKTVRNKELKSVSLLHELGSLAKEEALIPGMEEETDSCPAPDNGDEAEKDEHVWLSLKNAVVLVCAMSDTLCKADEKNAAVYRENSQLYCKNLLALDSAYKQAVALAKNRTLVFADRFPFRYLADDYNLECFAAFPGCSAETEASFKTIRFLADKIDEKDLPYVMVIDKSDKKIARTVISSSAKPDRKILTLDSMQSVSLPDEKSGVSYITIMQKNLNTLNAALR